MRHPLHNRLQRMAKDRWARRGIRTLLRSMVLGLSLLSVGLGLNLLLGWSLEVKVLGALALLCLGVGAFVLLRPRMKLDDVAQRLDQRFDLNQQLVTALEVSTSGTAEGVGVHLLDRATHTANRLQRQINARQRFPWAEITTLLALALVVIGLLLMMGLNPPVLPTGIQPLPNLSNPDNLPEEEFPPEPFAGAQSPDDNGTNGQGQPQMSPDSGSGGNNQESIAALADALRDQGATRPAADALDQNDTAGAAQQLRELADRASELSPETRNEIADALQDAADNIGADNMPLTDQLRQSSYGLQLDDQSAAQALEDLADAVEQLGGDNQQPPEQSASQGASQSSQSGDSSQGNAGSSGAGNADSTGQRELDRPSERLGVEGVPLELEEDGTGSVPNDEDAEEQETSDGGQSGVFERSGSSDNDINTRNIGEDPQHIPADLRDVVREYFSPSP